MKFSNAGILAAGMLAAVQDSQQLDRAKALEQCRETAGPGADAQAAGQEYAKADAGPDTLHLIEED